MSESRESQQLALIDPEASEGTTLDYSAPQLESCEARHLRRTIPAVLALLGCALLALSVAARQSALPSTRLGADSAGVVELAEVAGDEEDPCQDLPFLRLEKVLHSNLGGQGPDEGDEGVIFQASAYHSGVRTKVAEVHLHALTEYKPTWPKANGIHGRFAELNLAPGTNATFQVYAVDPETKKNLTLSHGSFTFFDLDHGKNKHSAEYVQVGNFSHYYVANDTELEIVQHKDGTVTFRAGKEGDGGDNPTDPLALSPLQKRRAVTLNFQNLSSLTFVLGGTEGNTTRVFHFVLRPSLLCANTVLEDGTVMKALERAAGNVVPMEDGKARVSPSDVKKLADDYDCVDSSAVGDWSDAKKTWCCDKKDIGCEVLGIGDDGELLRDENETGEEENGTVGNATVQEDGDVTTTPSSHSGAAQATVGAALVAALAWFPVMAWASA